MNPTELKDTIVKILDEKGGNDIQEIDLREKTAIADFFVIATGKNTPHVKALIETVEEKLEEQGIFATRKEGLSEGKWAILDYDDILVHIFNAQTRDFFCLEKLWK